MNFETFIKENKGILVAPGIFYTDEKQVIFKHQFDAEWNKPIDPFSKIKLLKKKKFFVEQKVAVINKETSSENMNKFRLNPFQKDEIVFIDQSQENIPLGFLRIKRKCKAIEVLDIHRLLSLKSLKK